MPVLPFWLEGVTPDIEKRAKEELGETPDVKKRTLKELKVLINETPDFYCFEKDEFLLRFLRAKKFVVKRAFKTLQNYYDFKKKYSGIMTENIRTILKGNYLFVHPDRLPNGTGILTLFVGRPDLEKFTVEEVLQATLICTELCIEPEASQICGAHLILDFKGITFKKLRQYSSPSHLAMIMGGINSSWPYRLCGIHITNEPFYISLMCNIIWPLLTKKMKERIKFYGTNFSNLHKHLPPQYLPQELNGFYQKDEIASQTKFVIAKHMELESVIKCGFLSPQRPAKKLSSCGLEEISGFLKTNPAMSKVAT